MKSISIKNIVVICSCFVSVLIVGSCKDKESEQDKVEPNPVVVPVIILPKDTAKVNISYPLNGETFSHAPTIKVESPNWDLSKAGNGIAYSFNGQDLIYTEAEAFTMFPNQSGLNTCVVFLTDSAKAIIGISDTVIFTLEMNPLLYQLTVNKGKGTWSYDRGQTAQIQSELEVPFVFSHWTGDNSVLSDTLQDPNSLKMPPGNVVLTAVGKAINVSFSRDVFPLMEIQCNVSGCHNSGGTPEFITYETIKANGPNIVLKTQNKQMPPQLFSTLTKDEIEIFRVWVEEGMKEN